MAPCGPAATSCFWIHSSSSSFDAMRALIVCVCACHFAETDILPPPYTTQITGNTFWLNVSYASHADAEASCSAHGGHLSAYVSMEEQKEVEQVSEYDIRLL